MTFKLEINCDNAAFEDMPEVEIARILTDLARDLTNGRKPGSLRDSNGNRVGHFTFKGKRPE